MILVGNDVVDLDDPAIAGSHLRPRLVDRICTPAEAARVRAARDPHAALWSHFAAKEAAYKVLRKLDPSASPGLHGVEVEAYLRAVRHRGGHLHLEIELGPGHVHALAWTAGPSPLRGVERVGGADPRLTSRRLLARAMARRHGGPERRWSVQRAPLAGSWDGKGPPVLLCDGRPSGVDVSLSHDGRFAAYGCSRTPATRVAGRDRPGRAGLPGMRLPTW